MEVAIEVEHVSKRFGATLALDDVSLEVESGGFWRSSAQTVPARRPWSSAHDPAATGQRSSDRRGFRCQQ